MSLHSPKLALSAAEEQRIVALADLFRGAVPDIAGALEMLNDPSWAVRREVVRLLGESGAPAVAPLCALLRARRDDEARIAAAVDALVASSADVLSEVAILANDPDPALAADGAQILGRRRSPNAVPTLAALVMQGDDNVAVAAIEALGRIGGSQAIETLIGAVESGNFFRVFPAIDVLGRSGDPRAIAPLAALLPNSMYTLEVARALGRSGEASAVVHLAGLFSNPGEAQSRVAAVALADLHAVHRERFGSDEAPADSLRQSAVPPAAIQRLLRATATATPEEQGAIAFLLSVIGGESAARGLRSMLDLAPPIREVASAGLKRLGSEADQEVKLALREGDSEHRRALLRVASRAALAPEVVSCLGDPDPTVRALACDALARMGEASSVSALFPLLADPSQRVVQAATGAIQSLGSAEAKELAVRFAGGDDAALRTGALRILAYFGAPDTLPAFLSALKNEEPRVRELALSGLALIERKEALDAIIDASQSDIEQTRAAAMRALGRCALEDSRIADVVQGALGDTAPWVRYYAAQALGRRKVESSTARLAELLADPAGQVRVAAIEALAQLEGNVALDALHRVASGRDPDMQRAALIGLGLTKRPEAIQVLVDAATNADPSTRLVALSALSEVSHSKVIPVLVASVDDVDENVSAAALGYLAAQSSFEATQALVELHKDPAKRERVNRLLSTANPHRVAGLVAALATADDHTAGDLAFALARLASAESIDALMRAMEMTSVPARKAAAVALGSSRQPKAVLLLQRAAREDLDPQVRQICAVIVGE